MNRKMKRLKNVHFVGIGGIGMSGIAEVLFSQGYKIQGSDLLNNNNTKRLKKLGIKVFLGHSVAQSKNNSDATAKIIDDEVRVLAEEAENGCRKIFACNASCF